jgi:hypothetical protein
MNASTSRGLGLGIVYRRTHRLAESIGVLVWRPAFSTNVQRRERIIE